MPISDPRSPQRSALFLCLLTVSVLTGCGRDDPADSSRAGTAPGDTGDTSPYAGIGGDDEVRFVTATPASSGRVRGATATLTHGDPDESSAIAVDRFAGRGGMSWGGTYNGSPFRLAVTEGRCVDAGREYPFVATLLVEGEQRNGCAWTEERGFKSLAEQPASRATPNPIAARALILREWRRAENRTTCAPVGFATQVEGTPRRAEFSGGWAVAWDRPGMRSAFGLAGTGLLAEDDAEPPAQRGRLASQWPLFRELEALPERSFAGYGIEGAGEYPSDNSRGRGLNSLAYVRIGGQTCDYNVWSRLGRADLERLLDSLRLIPPSVD